MPDPEVMPSWAQKRGIEGSYAELCANKVCTLAAGPLMLLYNGRTETQESSGF